MPHSATIGRTDLAVFPICLGANVFGWTADEERSFELLDAYVAGGGDFIDTANIYSAWADGNVGGESEAIIGRWIAARGRHDDVVIATKVGKEGGPGMPFGLSREKIRRGVEASLERLGVDRIDLYYAHEDDPDTPLEESLRALDELVREGIVGVLGASNYTAPRLHEALELSAEHGLARFEILQPLYSLVERDYEEDLAAVCADHEVSVAPYYALARGFLTGKYRRDGEMPSSPRAGAVAHMYMNDRGFAVLDALDEVAAAHDCTNGQAALAWLNAKPGVVAPIASATSLEQLDELLGAAHIELTPDEVARLDAASS